ncbi:hypothetical protein [Elizabethkingia miricola]|uniref:hypothetical protein n=1 Tax=Elizabethkingia miricola TaxID=172045 RepID=UPI000B35D0AA|nr:hypothetical protein [Elizabethkingia miricola]MDV2459848.1 hypothetical protein [Elizabethkingia anophelis]
MTIEIGKPIDEFLSEWLKEYTSKDDRADINADTGVSISLLSDITYRSRSVTEANKKGLICLIERAVENANKRMVHAGNCEKKLKEILDTI